ncbi:MAG: hypothetical protein KBE65_12280 [Phycisphaerae bacterium]|nr:hypothetical protein [Phycisphaerae bacterium]
MSTVASSRRWLCSVVLLASVANGSLQSSPGKGWPDERPANPPAAVGAPATRTTDPEALAKDVIARMDKAYYQLWDDPVIGFDAVYDVNEDGRKLGPLQVAFSIDANGGHFASKLPEETASSPTMYGYFENAWLESLFKSFPAEKGSATRNGDAFNLFYKDPSQDIRSRTLSVSGDYQLGYVYEAGTDLSQNKLTYKVQTLDGRHFVESFKRDFAAIMPPNRGRLFLTYLYTYARQDGVPFIQTLHIDYQAESGETTTEYKWDFRLRSVAIKKSPAQSPAATAAATDTGRDAGATPERPKKPNKITTQWDELSQEVIAGICRSNADFGAMPTFARSLRCDIDVQITSPLFAPASGTLNYWWEDADDNGLLVGEEIQIETAFASSPQMRLLMKDIERALILQTATAGANVFRDHFIQTVRIAEGYKMKLVPTEKDKPVNERAREDKNNLLANRGYDVLYLTVSPDFRIQRMRAVKEATETEMVLNAEYEKIAGVWTPTRYYREVAQGGRRTSTENMRCEYAMINGFPTMKKLTIDLGLITSQGTMSMKQEYTVRNPQIAWRNQPLDASKFVGGQDDEALFQAKPKKPGVDEDAALFR